MRCGTHAGAEAGARAQLVLARQLCDVEKVREYLWRGAEAYDRCGHLESAEEQLHELLECELSKEQKLEALCFLADVQARAPAQAGLQAPVSCVASNLLRWGCYASDGAAEAVGVTGGAYGSPLLLAASLQQWWLADEAGEVQAGACCAVGHGGSGEEFWAHHAQPVWCGALKRCKAVPCAAQQGLRCLHALHPAAGVPDL